MGAAADVSYDESAMTIAAPDPDAEARRSLARHRGGATLLLVLMAVLMVVSHTVMARWYAPDDWPRGLLEAASKAGLIGGIADWFCHHRAVPPPAGSADPAHRHHSAAEGNGWAVPWAARRHPCRHRRRGGRRAIAARRSGHPAQIPGRPGICASTGHHLGRLHASAACHGRGRPRAPPGGPFAAAHPGRAGGRARGRPCAARPGGGRAAPGRCSVSCWSSYAR